MQLKKFLQSLAIAIPLLLIKIYQYCISPYFPSACRFTPTCSQYGIDALRKYGFFKGLYKTIHRIARCNPWGGHGEDPA